MNGKSVFLIFVLYMLHASTHCGSRRDRRLLTVEDEKKLNQMEAFDSAEFKEDLVKTISVKIFPHDKDYKPHGKDEIRDRAVVVSQSSCEIYQASPDAAKKLPELIDVNKIIELDTRSLSGKALWIDCPTEFTLKRSSPLPSYTYLGQLYVTTIPNKSKNEQELLVVNIVDLESYLRGVVPSEVYPHWPSEALKAQAVAARTYAVFHKSFALKSQNQKYYDVDDTINYQAYTGISLAHLKTDAAIFATTSEILTHNRKVIQAYYHADSGGITENPEDAFGGLIAYCESRKEPMDPEIDSYITWDKVISDKELSILAGLQNSDEKIVSIDTHQIERTSSGRVRYLTVQTSKNKSLKINGKSFASSLGLKSQLYNIQPIYGPYRKKENAQYLVEGRGFGHGVGMSQLGAQILADRKSWNYTEILNFYFKNIDICQIHECGKSSAKLVKSLKRHESKSKKVNPRLSH